jgi:polysaccharide chain length determinant protein (PEP-CTERM system associated)
MQAIAQQVLGRTMLEKVVNEFNLFDLPGSRATLEDRVEMLRRRVELTIRRNDTFSISFDAEAPEIARRVAARLAALFIEENIKVREQQASGTTNFISTEAERLRRELEEQEAEVNRFRARYWYELPENRAANIAALERARSELENTVSRLLTLQDRRAALEKQLAEGEIIATELSMLGTKGEGQAFGISGNLSRINELELLMQKYSDKHPDVIRLKREIEATREESSTQVPVKTKSEPGLATRYTLRTMLTGQITELKGEINALQIKAEKLRPEISQLQARVDNTPLRAIEVSKITRNYDITLRKYQDLLAKSLDSELSENMEKKQKGEQFQIVDPANLPQTPIAPNRMRLLAVALLVGLGGGLGVAFLLDNMKGSFKDNEELAEYAGVPVLAVLPAVTTRGSILQQRQERAIIFLTSCGALAVGLTLLRVFGHMLPIK